MCYFYLFRIFSNSASSPPFLSINKLVLLKFIYALIQILNILLPLFSEHHLFYRFTIPSFFLKSVGSTPCIVQAVCTVWLGFCDKCNLTFHFFIYKFRKILPTQ